MIPGGLTPKRVTNAVVGGRNAFRARKWTMGTAPVSGVSVCRALRGSVVERRASKAELKAWREELAEWQQPRGFSANVQMMSRRHGDHLLDQPGSVFRDAYVASKCALTWGAQAVRLGADPPDFELMFAGRIECYEVAEVLAPGRRRGDELKADRRLSAEARSRPRNIPHEQWTPAKAALAEISRVVQRKMNNVYPSVTTLVLYINISFVANSEAYKKGIPEAVAPALKVFKSVWWLENGLLGGLQSIRRL